MFAGMQVKCPKCSQMIDIQGVVGNDALKSPKPSGNVMLCPQCGKALAIRPELAGMKVKCPGCSKEIDIPAIPRNCGYRREETARQAKNKKSSYALFKIFGAILVCLVIAFLWDKVFRHHTYAEKSKTYVMASSKYPRQFFLDTGERLAAMEKIYPELVNSYNNLKVQLSRYYQASSINKQYGLIAYARLYKDCDGDRANFREFTLKAFQYAAVAPHGDPIHNVTWGCSMLLDYNEKEHENKFDAYVWEIKRKGTEWRDENRNVRTVAERLTGNSGPGKLNADDNYSLKTQGEIKTAFKLIEDGMNGLIFARKPTVSKYAELGVGEIVTNSMNNIKGACIKSIQPNSFADIAGLKLEDIIVEVGGQKILDRYDFGRATSKLKVGDNITVHYIRGRHFVSTRKVVIHFTD